MCLHNFKAWPSHSHTQRYTMVSVLWKNVTSSSFPSGKNSETPCFTLIYCLDAWRHSLAMADLRLAKIYSVTLQSHMDYLRGHLRERIAHAKHTRTRWISRFAHYKAMPMEDVSAAWVSLMRPSAASIICTGQHGHVSDRCLVKWMLFRSQYNNRNFNYFTANLQQAIYKPAGKELKNSEDTGNYRMLYRI